jgi:transposase
LIRPSFVPPEPIRELRDLTRYRAVVVRDRTREVQRLHAVLEDAGIKIDVFVSDILGVSGRHMIEALIAGERDPQVLAELARGRMRRKRPALVEALRGRFTTHHGWMCRLILDRIDAADADVARLDAHITAAMAPFRDSIARLTTIPGVGERVAEVIIAETGGDMTRFGTAAQLSSWAGFCPGNNESAGKHFSGRTRKGDRWLAAALGEAARAAARTRGTHLAERYRRLAHRRGRKRAVVATGRIILETAWTLLQDPNLTYRDLGADWHERHQPTRRRATNLVHQLQAMGYRVTLDQAA